MPNDTELILSALQEKLVRKDAKKLVLQEFDDELGLTEYERIDPKTDAISKMAKRIKRRESKEKRKLRPVMEWTNTDFLVFAQDKLKAYNVVLENNGNLGADLIGRLYDRLASVLQDAMDNRILREYLDWWILSYASSIKTHSVFIQTMYDEKYLVRFLKRYNEQAVMPQTKEEKKAVEQTDETIFNTGGIPMLLMSKGIVRTHSYLKLRAEENIFTKITKALRAFSPAILRKVMDNTIDLAPYPLSDKVDFVSIARPALEMHGLKNYLNMDYGQYFKEHKR